MTSRDDEGDRAVTEGDVSGEDSASAGEPGQKRRRRRRHRKPADDRPTQQANLPAPSSRPGRSGRPARPARSAQSDHQSASREKGPRAAPSRESSSSAALPPNDASQRAEVVPATVDPGGEDDLAEDRAPGKTSIAWGTDDDRAVRPFELAPEFPPEPPAADPDPVSYDFVVGPSPSLDHDLASVVGARFVPAGRVTWFVADDQSYSPGERVLVESDRGPRLAWIATPPSRKPVPERGARRVIRRATERDLSGERQSDAKQSNALRTAKDAAAALRLPLKVFRVEVSGAKLIVYYTAEERLDMRGLVHSISQAMNMGVELRQIGNRDEAKLVGGIGSCGLALCCSTWLPEFVPVSIKMAKDQGLVLSPSRVSGQCGRLKCCLVYEQETYAELRKGLPKLGKRVVSARGEGRVVEVDVLTQRVRVSYAPGDTELLPATDVTPRFPSDAPPGKADKPRRERTAPRAASQDNAQDDAADGQEDNSDDESDDLTNEST